MGIVFPNEILISSREIIDDRYARIEDFKHSLVAIGLRSGKDVVTLFNREMYELLLCINKDSEVVKSKEIAIEEEIFKRLL